MTNHINQASFPPGTRSYAYVIAVDFPADLPGLSAGRREVQGDVWLSPGYDADGVRDHLAGSGLSYRDVV
jgi:hypothetical protein